ncbi:hypothetical protein PM082_004200 [Marasmius tenuissimus]|nr:hypothetical protein PM082_004200 [Marasmius tenuissimus]
MLSAVAAIFKKPPHHHHHLHHLPLLPPSGIDSPQSQPFRQTQLVSQQPRNSCLFCTPVSPLMERHTFVRNRNYGSGVQANNNDTGTQNIDASRHVGYMFGGEVQFVENFNSTAPNPHKSLWDAIAGVGASHTAEQQYDRGECLEGTRVKALGGIHDWIKQREQPFLWLTGAAGVGKSAIAMTVAKACEKDSLISSFFFSRSDPKRNNPSALFLSIAHGLTTISPTLRKIIEQRISKDPMILEARMEEQFRELIVQPLVSQPHPMVEVRELVSLQSTRRPDSTEFPNVVIIDGLDECGDERAQLRILSTIQSAFEHLPHFPLRFLICSRPEAWIREAFIAKPLRPLIEPLVLVLDDSFSPDQDIRRYYLHHFQEISSDPKYTQVLFPSPWPSVEILEILVARACGQFIFAATIVRFLKGAFRHPLEQLRVILENISPRRPGTSPYQPLDALHNYILNVNPDYEEVSLILGAILVIPRHASTPACLELLLDLPAGHVALTLRGMHSVLNIGGPDVVISLFHNSFREYLADETRSQHFHININTQQHAIARQWLQGLAASKIRTYSSDQLHDRKTRSFFMEWRHFCTSIPKPTWDLLVLLWNVDLASTYLVVNTVNSDYNGCSWESVFWDLKSWVRKYHADPKISEHKGSRDRLPSYDNDQSEAPSRKMGEGADRGGLGLVEDLVHKLQNHPACFHLE